MTSFLDALDERVLVCDGAMGTMLYAKGVFINQCFDSLNLTASDTVAEVHQDYVRAGADVIETNTFGANRVRLRAFGLGDRVGEINQEGVRLARRAAKSHAFVAGAMGPLGVRIEPWGKMGVDEAQAYFAEQVDGLLAGGVDLFLLETFRDVNEMGAAIKAVRSRSALPIVAQMTIEGDGNTLDGTPPEEFAPALEAFGADVIGVNCSIGPAHMLETVERIAAATRARLSAQPNAGLPRDVEGRNIYLSSPEYMASYARRFAQQGVRLVGGCCGTTPEHIRQIKMAVAELHPSARAGRSRGAAASVGAETEVRAVAREDKSQLARALASGDFVTMIGLVPPKGVDARAIVDDARALKIRGVDVVTMWDQAHGPRMSALSAAVLIEQRAGIEAVLQYACRDRNIVGMQSDLLGAHAMGMRNVLLVTGEPRSAGGYADATEVFDVDAVGLTNVVARLNRGHDIGGQAIGPPTGFHVGVMVNPAPESLDAEVRRFEHKVAAGAEFAVTRPVFDVDTFLRLHERLAGFGIPIVAGLWPLESLVDAEFMANEVPGVSVPASVLARMRAAGEGEAAGREGIAVAREVAVGVRGRAAGVHVAAPGGRVGPALAVLEALA